MQAYSNLERLSAEYNCGDSNNEPLQDVDFLFNLECVQLPVQNI